MSYKKIVFAGVILILTIDFTGKVNCYTSAQVTSPAVLRIVESKNALIAIPESTSFTLTQGSTIDLDIPITNNIGVNIIDISVDQQPGSLLDIGSIAWRDGNGIGRNVVLSLRSIGLINLENSQEISEEIIIKVKWDKGQAEISHKLYVTVTTPEPVNDNFTNPSTTNGPENNAVEVDNMTGSVQTESHEIAPRAAIIIERRAHNGSQ